jgi:hypothetical protein
VILFVMALTTLGATAPVARGLYAVAYPGLGSNVVTSGKSFEKALAKAELKTRFDTKTLTENEPSTFTATIIYGVKPSRGGTTIKVAFENDATLTPKSKKDFDITPLTARRQFLDEGHKRPGGGYELDWRWTVTPRKAGSLSLTLTIQPVLILKGSNRTDLETRNPQIQVRVRVNPAATALSEVIQSAENLQTNYPKDMIVNEVAEWSATLSLNGHADTVNAKVDLVQEPGSADAEITKRPPTRTGDLLVARWAVKPIEKGTVKLKFAVDASADSGDKTIHNQAAVTALAIASVPPSFWELVQAPVLWLTPFVGLAVGILGLRAALGVRRRGKDDGEPTGG